MKWIDLINQVKHLFGVHIHNSHGKVRAVMCRGWQEPNNILFEYKEHGFLQQEIFLVWLTDCVIRWTANVHWPVEGVHIYAYVSALAKSISPLANANKTRVGLIETS